jgi:hypothetical protein
MTHPTTHTGREALREVGFALAAVVCAVVLAGGLGLLAGPEAAPSREARAPTARTSKTARAESASSRTRDRWEAGLTHAGHVGLPQPASRDQVDPAASGARSPSPFVPRVGTLRALLARYDAGVLAQAQRLLARALPDRLTPLADRPRTANCPARGPPAWG